MGPLCSRHTCKTCSTLLQPLQQCTYTTASNNPRKCTQSGSLWYQRHKSSRCHTLSNSTPWPCRSTSRHSQVYYKAQICLPCHLQRRSHLQRGRRCPRQGPQLKTPLLVWKHSPKGHLSLSAGHTRPQWTRTGAGYCRRNVRRPTWKQSPKAPTLRAHSAPPPPVRKGHRPSPSGQTSGRRCGEPSRRPRTLWHGASNGKAGHRSSKQGRQRWPAPSSGPS